MGEQNRIRKTAYAVLRKHKIINPSLDDLVQIAKELGFDVIDYSKFSSESSAEVLIRELGLESFAKNGKSFLYKNNKIKLIFLCETMDAKEKLYALAHELGHIYCGHLKRVYVAMKQIWRRNTRRMNSLIICFILDGQIRRLKLYAGIKCFQYL